MSLARVEAARAFIGRPFAHQGRTVHGMDCAGLLLLAERACGRELRDIDSYGRTPDAGRLLAAVEDNFGPALDRDPMPGDVLLMRFEREPQHLGIVGLMPYGENVLSLIHTYASQGRVLEMRLCEKWQRRIIGVYR